MWIFNQWALASVLISLLLVQLHKPSHYFYIHQIYWFIMDYNNFVKCDKPSRTFSHRHFLAWKCNSSFLGLNQPQRFFHVLLEHVTTFNDIYHYFSTERVIFNLFPRNYLFYMWLLLPMQQHDKATFLLDCIFLFVRNNLRFHLTVRQIILSYVIILFTFIWRGEGLFVTM